VRRIWIVTVLLSFTLAAGCRQRSAGEDRSAADTTAQTGAPAAEAAADPGPQVVTVVATEYAFAPQEPIPAGVTQVRLEDRGRQPHHMELYRLADGKTVADLRAELESPRPMPGWVVGVGGPGAVGPGETVDAIMLLDPGSYAYVCYAPDSAGAPHFKGGMLQAVEIASGPARATAEPAADLTLTLGEYGFTFSEPPTAGRHTIRVENPGAQMHQAFLYRLDPGRTLDEFVRWTDAGETGPAPGRWASGLSALSPGLHAYFTTTFEPGEYVVICYVGDTADGRPHYLHGMVQQFTVR
jgi:hypothetical protein